MLHDQEAMMILHEDGHELEACECSTDLKLSEVPTQAAEDSRVVAADVEHLVALQIEVAVQGFDQHLRRGDEDIECPRKHGDCWMEFYFHDKRMVTLMI